MVLEERPTTAWAHGIADRMNESGIEVEVMPVSPPSPHPGLVAHLARANGLNGPVVCSVCIDGTTTPEWLRGIAADLFVFRGQNPGCRVFPILLPGATVDIVYELWPPSDWIDFRETSEYELTLARLAGAVSGQPGHLPVGLEMTVPKPLSFYEERIRDLARLRSAGLSEEVRIEVERKLLQAWIHENEWAGS